MNDPVGNEKVDSALKGSAETQALSAGEQEVCLDRMAASDRDTLFADDAFFLEHGRFDLGVGIDEASNIVCQDPHAPDSVPYNLDAWMAAGMKNMKRMTADEAYRKLIASRLS